MQFFVFISHVGSRFYRYVKKSLIYIYISVAHHHPTFVSLYNQLLQLSIREYLCSLPPMVLLELPLYVYTSECVCIFLFFINQFYEHNRSIRLVFLVGGVVLLFIYLFIIIN